MYFSSGDRGAGPDRPGRHAEAEAVRGDTVRLQRPDQEGRGLGGGRPVCPLRRAPEELGLRDRHLQLRSGDAGMFFRDGFLIIPIVAAHVRQPGLWSDEEDEHPDQHQQGRDHPAGGPGGGPQEWRHLCCR